MGKVKKVAKICDKWSQRKSVYRDEDIRYCDQCLTKLVVSKIRTNKLSSEDSIDISITTVFYFKDLQKILNSNSIRKITNEYDKNYLAQEHDIFEWSNFDWDYMTVSNPNIGIFVQGKCPKCDSDLKRRLDSQKENKSMIAWNQLMSFNFSQFRNLEKVLIESACPECGNFKNHDFSQKYCYCMNCHKCYWGYWLRDYVLCEFTASKLNWYIRRFLIFFFFMFVLILTVVKIISKLYFIRFIFSNSLFMMTILKFIVSDMFLLSIFLVFQFAYVYERIINQVYYYDRTTWDKIKAVIWGILINVWPILWLILVVTLYHSEYSFLVMWPVYQFALLFTATIIITVIYILLAIIKLGLTMIFYLLCWRCWRSRNKRLIH